MIRLGLTGGIGSGKSTVAQFLCDRGAAVVDADAISRQLSAPGGAAIESIAAAFGADFITAAGAMDRDRMRALAYADATARKRLEAIIHPLVGLETQRQLDTATREQRACVVFDVPLLAESPVWRKKVDHILVVDCTPDVQIIRVMARNPLTREEVEKIIASQATRASRVSVADSVIFNVNLSLDELDNEVQQISHRFGLSLA